MYCDANIFPKTRGNKNKQWWTHLVALKSKVAFMNAVDMPL